MEILDGGGTSAAAGFTENIELTPGTLARTGGAERPVHQKIRKTANIAPRLPAMGRPGRRHAKCGDWADRPGGVGAAGWAGIGLVTLAAAPLASGDQLEPRTCPVLSRAREALGRFPSGQQLSSGCNRPNLFRGRSSAGVRRWIFRQINGDLGHCRGLPILPPLARANTQKLGRDPQHPP